MAKAPAKKLPAFDPTRAPEGLTEAAQNPISGDPSAATQRPRSYKGTEQVDHDAFRLEPAPMKRNLSYTEIPEVVGIDHTHIFHTVDSNGKKQYTSNAVGGHHHDVTVSMGATGVPEITVGPARKWVLKKVRGVKKKLSVAIAYGADVESGDDGIVDDHTHATTYLFSEKITLRQASVEFAKFESGFRANRESAVEGVRSGRS